MDLVNCPQSNTGNKIPTEKHLHSQTLIQCPEHTSDDFRSSVQDPPTTLALWLAKGGHREMASYTRNMLQAGNSLPPMNDF